MTRNPGIILAFLLVTAVVVVIAAAAAAPARGQATEHDEHDHAAAAPGTKPADAHRDEHEHDHDHSTPAATTRATPARDQHSTCPSPSRANNPSSAPPGLRTTSQCAFA